MWKHTQFLLESKSIHQHTNIMRVLLFTITLSILFAEHECNHGRFTPLDTDDHPCKAENLKVGNYRIFVKSQEIWYWIEGLEISKHLGRFNTLKILPKLNTVSRLLQLQGSIFQNGFLDGVQFKFGQNFTNFLLKVEFFTGFIVKFAVMGFYLRVEFK